MPIDFHDIREREREREYYFIYAFAFFSWLYARWEICPSMIGGGSTEFIIFNEKIPLTYFWFHLLCIYLMVKWRGKDLYVCIEI